MRRSQAAIGSATTAAGAQPVLLVVDVSVRPFQGCENRRLVGRGAVDRGQHGVDVEMIGAQPLDNLGQRTPSRRRACRCLGGFEFGDQAFDGAVLAEHAIDQELALRMDSRGLVERGFLGVRVRQQHVVQPCDKALPVALHGFGVLCLGCGGEPSGAVVERGRELGVVMDDPLGRWRCSATWRRMPGGCYVRPSSEASRRP